MQCGNEEYILNSGVVIIFNPQDQHSYEQVDGRALDYRCINVQPEIMSRYVQEITGSGDLPRFTQAVLFQSELAAPLHDLHQMLLEEQADFQKEELLLFLLEQLLQEYIEKSTTAHPSGEVTIEIKRICRYIEEHYTDTITLGQLTELTDLASISCSASLLSKKASPPTVIWRRSASIRSNVCWSKGSCRWRLPCRPDSVTRAISAIFSKN